MIDFKLYPDIVYENVTYTNFSEEIISKTHPIMQVYNANGKFNLLVIGEGSMGKSTLSAILQAQLLHNRVPCHLFECKYFNKQNINDIHKLNCSSNSVVILDGLDEIKGSVKSELFYAIGNFIQNNIQLIVTSRYNPKNSKIDEDKMFSNFKIAELQAFSEKRISNIVGNEVLNNDGYAKLLRNTMFLALHLEFVKKGVDKEYSLEIFNESDFLEKYFKLLYRQKEYGDDYKSKYLTDLTSLGSLLYDRFFSKSNKDNYMFIPKELSHLFYYKDNILYSTHLKYENFALALYLKRELTNIFLRWKSNANFINDYISRLFSVKLNVLNEQGVEHDSAEAFYYLGQMLRHVKNGKTIIKSMNNKEYKKPNSLFSNILCVYLGYNNDIFDDNACNVDSTFKDILPELERFYIMYFCRFIRYLHTKYIYDAEPLKSKMINLVEINVSNKFYTSKNNCLIIKEDHSLDLACINSIIPDDGSVEKILDLAFSRIKNLKQIIIPKGVKQIEDNAIYQCEQLEHLEIGPDVWYISPTAVLDCPRISKLTVNNNTYFHDDGNCIIDTERKILTLGCKDSQIPSDRSVVEISEDTFVNIDGLEKLYIPNGIETIRIESVVRCQNMESIFIGKDVKYIENGAFSYCYKLQSICVDPQNQYYKSIDNCLVEIKSKRVMLVANRTKIPNKKDVSIIASGAFSCWKGIVLDYSNFTIPNNIDYIEHDAFDVVHGKKAIANKYYYNNIAYIGNKNNPHLVAVGCHLDCKEISFHPDVKIIYKLNGKYDVINIPDSVSSISEGAFDEIETYDKLIIGKATCNIGIPLNITEQPPIEIVISKDNSYYASLDNSIIDKRDGKLILGSESGIIPNGVTQIGDFAFAHTYIEQIIMPDTIKQIGSNAFELCDALRKVKLSNNITEIPDGAFLGCISIENLIIPHGVKIIGKEAFNGCENLKYVFIPDTVTKVKIDRYGRIPFSHCTRIKKISVPKHLAWMTKYIESNCEIIIR